MLDLGGRAMSVGRGGTKFISLIGQTVQLPPPGATVLEPTP